MTAFSEPIDHNAPVDDLTDAVCARCGTRHDLDRPNSLLVAGEYHGRILCTTCVLFEHIRGQLVDAAKAKIEGRAPVCPRSDGCPICDKRRRT